eukprot:scaffold112109_cov28-Tisochrysis_lutea.AAC.5
MGRTSGIAGVPGGRGAPHLTLCMEQLEVRHGRCIVRGTSLPTRKKEETAEPVRGEDEEIDDAQHTRCGEGDTWRPLEAGSSAVDGGVPIDESTDHTHPRHGLLCRRAPQAHIVRQHGQRAANLPYVPRHDYCSRPVHHAATPGRRGGQCRATRRTLSCPLRRWRPERLMRWAHARRARRRRRALRRAALGGRTVILKRSHDTELAAHQPHVNVCRHVVAERHKEAAKMVDARGEQDSVEAVANAIDPVEADGDLKRELSWH